ncbi:hypothetical protein N431DRAFT_496722 [Stipitochalara longipes BDJ]|nr:hypothetical protein N431DRAFT_496722 [Stipitochalara longipes BDJ]
MRAETSSIQSISNPTICANFNIILYERNESKFKTLINIHLKILINNISSTGFVMPLSLIINLSSFAALYPISYISIYMGSKAFNLAWDILLKAVIRAKELDSILGIIIAKSWSTIVRTETSFFVPSAREMARRALEILVMVAKGEKAKSEKVEW